MSNLFIIFTYYFYFSDIFGCIQKKKQLYEMFYSIFLGDQVGINVKIDRVLREASLLRMNSYL